MKYILVFLTSILVGCGSVAPIKQQFPDAPETLLKKCPELQKLETEAKLSDVAKVINNNYSAYYECSNVHDAFIEWYYVQKKIFEELK